MYFVTRREIKVILSSCLFCSLSGQLGLVEKTGHYPFYQQFAQPTFVLNTCTHQFFTSGVANICHCLFTFVVGGDEVNNGL